MKLFRFKFRIALVSALAAGLVSTTLAQTRPFNIQVKPLSPKIINGPLILGKQGSFFVGGREVESNTLSTLPAYASSGNITVDQMYVHFQSPVKAKASSVVLIHGCCLTGKTWESTPDGRKGNEAHVHPSRRSECQLISIAYTQSARTIKRVICLSSRLHGSEDFTTVILGSQKSLKTSS